MPNKKINALDVRVAVSTDLMLVGDPSTGTAYKSTLLTLPLVPYTGATTNVNLGEFQLSAGQVTFDQTPTGTSGIGVMRWNDSDGTLDLGLKGGNVTLQVGQEQVIRVVNKSGIALTEAAYQVVKITDAQGQRLAVDLAQGNNDANSTDTIGIVTETIANNQEGFVTTSGIIRGINTTGSLQSETWVDGDVLYLSPTTAGAITKVKPTAPNHSVILGYVVYAHINQGKIFVKCDNGYELGELHDVYVPTPSNNDGIFWNTANSRYQNNSIAGVLGFTPVAGNIYTTDGTISGNRTITLGSNILNIGASGGSTGQVLVNGVNGAAYAFAVYSSNILRFGVTGFGGVTTNNNVLDVGTNYVNARYIALGTIGELAVIDGQAQATGIVNLISLKLSSGVKAFSIPATGNVLINTSVDAGFKLDVSGTARISSNLTANSFIKSGGTSAQILAADGSVITAGTNITISGGTISSSGGGGGSMEIGGAITSATAGSVLFAGASGVLQQDNANLFWDDTNNRLGIRTATPSVALELGTSTLGAEQLINSTLGSNIAPAISTGNYVVNGGYSISAGNYQKLTSGNWGGGSNSISVIGGVTYDVTVVCNSFTSGSVNVFLGSVFLFTINAVGTYNKKITSLVTTSGSFIFNNSNAIFTVNSILIRPLSAGNLIVNNGLQVAGNFSSNNGTSSFSIKPDGNVNFINKVVIQPLGVILGSTDGVVDPYVAKLSIITDSGYTGNMFRLISQSALTSGYINFFLDYGVLKLQQQVGGTSYSNALVIDNGNILLNTATNAGYRLDVNGTARVSGKLSVGTPSAASSVMEVTSTTQGFLPPRMTTTQKNAISSPAAGLMVYDTTLNKLCVYTTAWETITSV